MCEARISEKLVDDVQFGFWPERGNSNSDFVLRCAREI